ncbi:hypothetical protein [Aquimarina sp. 2201CG5-10]|uniref:hypothetical protein n=1 Tax=Aquimarina callyspongiae TaxID=3098150 RepID=UPI002AB46B54|nr:hypothetical protein [Aquimarina sp. 2201CG5-10]MDY8135346.1 hypothetical protein [Aquimarina sp. 2201CG5-10]
MKEEEEEENKNPRRTWDLMIGIALVLFGSLRLYTRIQTETGWGINKIITVSFILYGVFLIYRHFQSSSNN